MRSSQQPVLEALKATGASLRLRFKPNRAAKPGIVIIAVLNYLKAPLLGITDTLLETVIILVPGSDV